MSTAATILALALLAQPPAPTDDPVARSAGHARSKYLLEVYTAEAAGYTIYRDASRKEKLELRREPVYVWNNRVRDGGQEGAVYVWTHRGRAEVIGTLFSFPRNAIGALSGPRDLCQEFHSLSLSVLDVSRSPQANRWTPRAPGIQFAPIAGAQRPARSAPQRLAQMRALAHEFSAKTRDHTGRQWELRLLPQPLYRYESTDPEVADGAIFAFVTSAGTDPEVFLVLEARKPPGGGEPAWQYAAARFTDLDLWVSHKEKVIFTATYIPLAGIDQDGQYRYHVFKDRVIPAMGKQP
jgi:hypothetical protein